MALFLLSSVASLIFLIGFLAKDIPWLKILSIGGLACLFPYYYFQAEPPWVPLGWNVAYIAVHFIRVREVFEDRRPVDFTREENDLYMRVFDSLTPRQFEKILRIGRWRDLEPGYQIQSDGNPAVLEIAFLFGSAESRKNDRWLASYGPGDFAGLRYIYRNEGDCPGIYRGNGSR